MTAEAAHTAIVDVRTTLDDPEVAHHIARSVVDERLAACAHVSAPIVSYYWWEDELQCTAEYEVVVRTSPERAGECSDRILSLHPYGLPALVVVPGEASAAYGRWVHEGCRPA